MADTYKTVKNLTLVAEFTDGDTRTLTLDNPKENLTATQINALNTPAAAVLVGDKDKSDFLRFKSAKKRTTTTMYLDITPEG